MSYADKVKIKRVQSMTLDITLVGNNILETQTLLDDINTVLGMGVGIGNLQIVGE